MSLTLTIKRRENTKGQMCIAPFIDNKNIWDIPEKHWVEPIQEAILAAYRIGYERALSDVAALRCNVPYVMREEMEWVEEGAVPESLKVQYHSKGGSFWKRGEGRDG